MLDGVKGHEGTLVLVDPNPEDLSDSLTDLTPINIVAGRQVVVEYGRDVLAFDRSF